MNRAVGKARGVLRGPKAQGTSHHARVAPSEALAGLVQHFWIVRWDFLGDAPQVAETLPHPNVHLVLEPGRTRIVGVQTGRFTRILEGRGSVFGVKFRAGGFRPYLKRSVSTLRDGSIPLSEVFDAASASLEDEVFAREDDRHMIDAVERFLARRLPAADPKVERVARMVDDIAADRSITRVDHLTERWALGKRPLQQLFNEYVGVGPKWVINRYRLHEAVERLATREHVSLTELALDLGYFDQAHFIRDFRALAGCTPAAYLRERGASRGSRQAPKSRVLTDS